MRVRVSVRVSVRARATSQIWEQKRCALLLRTRQPKFLHRPKRLRCDSDPAGAATPQIAPPTRRPRPAAGSPTHNDARHSRHARSRSHHGHRSATVTPESLQAAGKLPCATTLSSLDAAVVTRRRRRVTSFAFPSGGAPTGASLHLTDSLCNDGGPGAEYADCADCGLRFPPLRPCAPRRARCNWLPTPIATTAAPARVPPGPGRRHMWDRTIEHRLNSHVVTKVTVVCRRRSGKREKGMRSSGAPV